MKIIVFSKDRPLQLDAFLRSYQTFVVPVLQVYVLYKATLERYARAYAQVFERHPFVTSCPETVFRGCLLELLSDEHTLFFVDDQVFTRTWGVIAFEGLSLRLGLNLTSDYNSCVAEQVPPPYESCGDDVIRWRWVDGHAAWGYPLSLDGHVFDGYELRSMAASVPFHSPNTLESALQQFRPRYADRYGYCYRESRVVNVPWNLTQTDWWNRNAGEADVYKLLQAWESGYQVDLQQFKGVLNQSTHQEFPLMLEKR